MIILDGKSLAEQKKIQLKARVSAFRSKYGRVPRLAVILVGDDPASQIYVRSKLKACESVGVSSAEYILAQATTPNGVSELIQELNEDDSTDGILLQLPLPRELDSLELISQIDPKKDVDCLTSENIGKLVLGTYFIGPCTPAGILSLLDHYQIDCDGKYAVVLGRSQIVGKPIAQMLSQRNATVTLCHSKTKNLKEFTKQADILIVAVGQRNLIGKDDVKKGVVVIDVGMNREESKKLVGDVNQDELKDVAFAMTPVPGGVGPMTIITLLENTMTLAELRKAQK